LSPDKKQDYDKLPGTVESSNFRKTSDDFTFTIATPRKHEEYAKAFMGRLSSFGVFLFAPCSAEEVESLLKNETDAPKVGNPEPEVIACQPISLAALADLIDRDERTVQLYEEKGVFVRLSRGWYDRDKAIAGLWKAFKDAERSTGDALRNERVMITRAKREAAQLDNLERAKKLGNCDECIKVRVLKNANIKQRILAFEKVLPQKTGGRTAEEQVPIIRNEIRKLLTDLAATERPVGDDSRSRQDLPAAAGLHGEPVGGRKAKARRKN